MSESIIACLGMGFLIGAFTTITILGVFNNGTNKRHNQRELDRDNDIRIYIPVRSRGGRRDNGCDQ